MIGKSSVSHLIVLIAAFTAASSAADAIDAKSGLLKTAFVGEQLRGTAFDGSLIPVPPLSRAIADTLDRQIRNAGREDRALLADLARYYAARNNRPIWLGEDSRAATTAPSGRLPERTSDLIARIGMARRDGLNPHDYAIPVGRFGNDDERADFEVGVSRTAVRFVRHLAAGRLKPATISRIITQNPDVPDTGAILDRLASGTPINTAVSEFEPKHPQYVGLKAALGTLLDSAGPEPIHIPGGPMMRPGSADWRVSLLRLRLGFVASAHSEIQRGTHLRFGRPVYDSDLAEAVRLAQAAAGLKADGIVGPKTLAVLNAGGRNARIADILVNLERWRWMPRDLGKFHVRANIPEFRLTVVRDGSPVHATRVVVGKTTNKTPVFSDEMEHIVVNPYWNIPASILRKEMLPSIRRNPRGYLARRGYEVISVSGGRARRVDPGSVNWSAAAAGRYRVRQRPGSRNALGRIKFMFPNRHAVYLHDTPSKSLFNKDIRAFSHGCVRVQNPLELADALLQGEPEWNGEKVRRLVGGNQRRINLTRKIPVHLSYFTLTVDTGGRLSTHPDVYGYDDRMRKALGL